MNGRFSIVLTLLAAIAIQSAHAELVIDITEPAANALPIAIVPFSGAADSPLDVADVVQSDLARSGRFAPIDRADMVAKPGIDDTVDLGDWRMLKTDAVVVGNVAAINGGYQLRFKLVDVYTGQMLLNHRVPVGAGGMRRAAHHIADLVYEKLTGEPGVFNTQIAYVSATGAPANTQYELVVADADGENPIAVATSRDPIMSPAWSPDGSRIAYVSFENRESAIFVQDVATGERIQASASPGVNGAPTFSPDGKKLALTLTKDIGNLDVFVLDLTTSQLRRITRNAAIDTEPTWAPDGRTLIFTSDRSGAPQVYRVSVDGGRPQRLSFEGRYNARPRLSPAGDRIAMVHLDDGRYRIATLNPDTGDTLVLTDGRLDESPSFAPNGSMIIYATQDRGRGVLAAVSVDGSVRQRLASLEGDVREPVWSPFRR